MMKWIVQTAVVVFAGTLIIGCASTPTEQAQVDQSGDMEVTESADDDETKEVEGDASAQSQKEELEREESAEETGEQVEEGPESTTRGYIVESEEDAERIRQREAQRQEMERAAREQRETIKSEHGIEELDCDDEAAIEAAFQEAEQQFEQWNDIEFQGDVDAQQEQLQQKLEGMEHLQVRYDQVVECEQPEHQVVGVYRIGRMMERMAAAVTDIPTPSEEELEKAEGARLHMEEMASPMEHQAADYYRYAVDLAERHDIDNQWAERAQKRLEEME